MVYIGGCGVCKYVGLGFLHRTSWFCGHMIPQTVGVIGQAVFFFFPCFCSFCRIEWYLGNRWHCRMLPARMREQVPALESAGELRHLFALARSCSAALTCLCLTVHTASRLCWPHPDPLPFPRQFCRAGGGTRGLTCQARALPLSRGPSPHSLIPLSVH